MKEFSTADFEGTRLIISQHYNGTYNYLILTVADEDSMSMILNKKDIPELIEYLQQFVEEIKK